MVVRKFHSSYSSWRSILNERLHGALERLGSTGAIFSLLFFMCLQSASASSNAATPPLHASPADVHVNVRTAADFGKVPLSFEPNRGQTDPRVQFLSRGPGYSLYLTPGEALLNLERQGPNPARTGAGSAGVLPPASSANLLDMQLLGANASAVAQGLEPQPGVVNYLIGSDPKKWHAGIPTYAKVRYTGVYPGIDLVFYGNQRQLEYDFVVAPGADPNQIAWKIAGSTPTIDADGNLLLKAANGPVSFKKPVVYQLENGNKVSIDGRYVVAGNEVRFALGNYDHTKLLVIDPVLSYATYLGGAVNHYSATNGLSTIGAWDTINGIAFGERTQGIAVDSDGCVYVVGSTNSTDFPLQNPYQNSAPGLSFTYITHAAFVTKFNPQGTGLIYSTYLAGAGQEGNGYMMPAVATAVSVDAQGNAYVVGYTNDYTFPVTPGAYQTLCGAGWTGSAPNFTRIHACGYDAPPSGFLTKLDPTGQHLVYSTFLGGARGGDYIFGVAVDTKGQAYVAGTSTDACQLFNGDPSFACFPTTAGAVLPGTASFFGYACPGSTCHGYSKMAFVSVFDVNGANLLYSTYVGENTPLISSGSVPVSMNGDTYGNAVAVDSAGDFFLTGITSGANLPITPGALQSAPSWLPTGSQGFVAKFSPVTNSGSTLTYLTYLGGPTSKGTNSWPSGIAANSAGEAYITGQNFDKQFPTTTGAYQTSCGGGAGGYTSCQNAFISKLNASGTGLIWSTMLGNLIGGTNIVSDVGPIQLDSAGNVYITGTASVGQAFPQVNPIWTMTAGQPQQFVAKFDPAGSQLLFSTFIGDTNIYASTYDAGMVVDAGGNIYLAGNTTVTGIPVTPGAFQQNFVGTGDGYIMKISQVLVLPTGQQVFAPSSAVSPLLSTVPSQAEPIGIGSVANGGSTFRIQIGLDQVSGLMDVYFAVSVSSLGPNILLLTSTGTFQSASEGVVPWMSGLSGPINMTLLPDTPTSILPPGTYTLYLLIAPHGSLATFYLWTTSFTI